MTSTISDEQVLLPCPFCHDRGRPRLIEQDDEDGRFAAVICDMCGCGSRQHYFCGDDARDYAASAWNTRAPDPRVVALIDATKDAVCALEVCGKDYPAMEKARAALAAMENGNEG